MTNFHDELVPTGNKLKEAMLMVDAADLVQTRRDTHGNWTRQAACARELKIVIATYDDSLTPSQREALDMIAVKISRILSGDPDCEDHWRDICGYAQLGLKGHDE